VRLQPDAGTYPLRVTGAGSVGGASVSVPSSASLVIQQRSATDQGQRTDGLPGGLVLVQRATPSGLDLLSFSLTASGRTLAFSPPSPLPFVRTDSPVGTSWSWTARSTDGTVTVTQTATVTSIGPVSVAGASIPAVTVTRVLTTTGAVQGTLQLTAPGPARARPALLAAEAVAGVGGLAREVQLGGEHLAAGRLRHDMDVAGAARVEAGQHGGDLVAGLLVGEDMAPEAEGGPAHDQSGDADHGRAPLPVPPRSMPCPGDAARDAPRPRGLRAVRGGLPPPSSPGRTAF